MSPKSQGVSGAHEYQDKDNLQLWHQIWNTVQEGQEHPLEHLADHMQINKVLFVLVIWIMVAYYKKSSE